MARAETFGHDDRRSVCRAEISAVRSKAQAPVVGPPEMPSVLPWCPAPLHTLEWYDGMTKGPGSTCRPVTGRPGDACLDPDTGAVTPSPSAAGHGVGVCSFFRRSREVCLPSECGSWADVMQTGVQVQKETWSLRATATRRCRHADEASSGTVSQIQQRSGSQRS